LKYEDTSDANHSVEAEIHAVEEENLWVPVRNSCYVM